MSALSQAHSSDSVTQGILDIARPIFAKAVWTWFDANVDRVLFSKWFIRIRVRDVRPLVEAIAGPDPSVPEPVPV